MINSLLKFDKIWAQLFYLILLITFSFYFSFITIASFINQSYCNYNQNSKIFNTTPQPQIEDLSKINLLQIIEA